MRCPGCKTDLIVVEAEGVELDWCPACNGVWFDEGEVEMLLGRREPLGQLFTSPSQVREPSRRCPRCAKRLLKVALGDTVLDQCPRGHGLWFDAGEVEALRQCAASDEGRQVVQYLLATFGSTQKENNGKETVQ